MGYFPTRWLPSCLVGETADTVASGITVVLQVIDRLTQQSIARRFKKLGQRHCRDTNLGGAKRDAVPTTKFHFKPAPIRGVGRFKFVEDEAHRSERTWIDIDPVACLISRVALTSYGVAP